MAEKLGVEVTEYTYEDALLMVEGSHNTRTCIPTHCSTQLIRRDLFINDNTT
jgi:hypothetical protein